MNKASLIFSLKSERQLLPNTLPIRDCEIQKIHNKKLDKVHSEKRYISKPKYHIAKNIINNISSYTLNIRRRVCTIVYLKLTHWSRTTGRTKNKDNKNMWKLFEIKSAL